VRAVGLRSLPTEPGGYRWYYADVAAGHLHAVVIFLVGSIFSPRYASSARRGATALQHCAVNFALYDGEESRAWVLSEYRGAEAGEGELRIGRSCVTWQGDGVTFEVDERTAPWGRPLRATLELSAETPAGDELQLLRGQPHHWQPLMPRAVAKLSVPTYGVQVSGRGYHDTNHGTEALGGSVPGWQWMRAHGADDTTVLYRLPDGEQLRVVASGHGVTHAREPGTALRQGRSGWGLDVPEELDTGRGRVARGGLLESSPFYARFASAGGGDVDVMGEAADFRRFHSPFIRWMAHFRTRVERES
jgi:carotenoid 1,2-hydratase